VKITKVEPLMLDRFCYVRIETDNDRRRGDSTRPRAAITASGVFLPHNLPPAFGGIAQDL
jgi:hypothetical protein